MKTAAASAVALAGLLSAPMALAQPFDQAQVDAGMLLYKPPLANCEVCHGWTGGGAFLHDEFWAKSVAPGPAILDSKLGRAAMIELVACGKVTSDLTMPKYMPSAWTAERPCYGGKVAADMAFEQLPPVAPYPLTQAQIEAVVTYVQAVYQSGGMTLGVCMKYFGEKSKGCDLFRQPPP